MDFNFSDIVDTEEEGWLVIEELSAEYPEEDGWSVDSGIDEFRGQYHVYFEACRN